MPPPTPRRRTPAKNANTSIFTFQAPSIRIPTFNSPIKRLKTPTTDDLDGAQTRDEARQARLRGPAGQTWNNLNTLLTRGPTKLPSFSAVPGANSRAGRPKNATPGGPKNPKAPKTPKKTPKTPSKAESTKKSARKSSVAAKTRVLQPTPRSATRSAAATATTAALKTKAAVAASAGPKSNQRRNGKRNALPSSPLGSHRSNAETEADREVEQVDEPVQVEAPPPPDPPLIASTSKGKTKAPPKRVPAKKVAPVKVSRAVAIRRRKPAVEPEPEANSDDSEIKVVDRRIKPKALAKKVPPAATQSISSSPPPPPASEKLDLEEINEPMLPLASTSRATIKAPSKRAATRTKSARGSKAVAVRQQRKESPDHDDQSAENVRTEKQPVKKKPIGRKHTAPKAKARSAPAETSEPEDDVVTLLRPSKHTLDEDLDGSISDSSFDDGPVVKRRKSGGSASAFDNAKNKSSAPSSLDTIFAGVRSKMVEKM
ncbi:BQ5605_C009g05532 [Microbotryum silenes-dioicae]|uniref:BQ5605_C009g05532 protein n=1 Tax=Microbotryum silenes-dioicae TaxID=796604 RepID=A0A2X0MI15_9BASI|nr:BQ5605_C009g05532 [Microbotryum silenes-dioicae]